MDNADKIAVVNRYVEAFDKADIGIIREMFATDAVVEDPVGTEPHRGIEAIVAFYENAFASGARLELSGDVRCAGNCVAFAFDVIIPGMRISPIDVFTFDDDGRVVDMKAYWSV